MGKLTLILGGARSGKSDYGERLAQTLADEVLFVATAQAFDEEMKTRIARHRQQRPSHWQTVEAPTQVALATADQPGAVVLLDCLTLLVSNLILRLGDPLDDREAETAVGEELKAILDTIQENDSHWIVISNEVGLGLVPDNRLGRLYRDLLGRANQRLAAAANEVIFMVAGLPLVVKDEA